MKVLGGIGAFFQTAGRQLVQTMNIWRYEPDKRLIHFSSHFQETAREHGVTEADALDVYYHGYVVKPNMMTRKYNGYEIGIYYFVAPDTGRIVIQTTWKKDRR